MKLAGEVIVGEITLYVETWPPSQTMIERLFLAG